MTEDKKPDVTQPAWDLFCSGDLAGAEEAAAAALKALKTATLAPIPDVQILRAFYFCRLHQFKQALTIFAGVLGACPDDAYAQAGYLLALQDQLAAERQANDGPPEQNMLLFGLGTGRSGSTSLTNLWQMQDNSYCSHEHPPRLKWAAEPSRFEFHRRRMGVLQSAYRFVGDVSHWWLPYVDQIMASFDNVRIVVLQREQAATVKSFMRIKGGGGKGSFNHWVDHDGGHWAKNIWDECYPSYEDATMEAAVERYWDDYYAAVDALVQQFPDRIRVFATEQLGEPESQREILTFCGFEALRLVEDLHLNKGDAADGKRMY